MKEATYKIQLYKYTPIGGWAEQKVIADFKPSKVDGHAVKQEKLKLRRR